MFIHLGGACGSSRAQYESLIWEQQTMQKHLHVLRAPLGTVGEHKEDRSAELLSTSLLEDNMLMYRQHIWGTPFRATFDMFSCSM